MHRMHLLGIGSVIKPRIANLSSNLLICFFIFKEGNCQKIM